MWKKSWQAATAATTVAGLLGWLHWWLSDGVTVIAGLEFNESGRLLIYMLVSGVPITLLITAILPKVWHRYNPAQLRSRRRQRLTELYTRVESAYERLQMVDGYVIPPGYGPDADPDEVQLSKARKTKNEVNLLRGPLHSYDHRYVWPDQCTTEIKSLRSWYECLEQIRIDIAGQIYELG